MLGFVPWLSVSNKKGIEIVLISDGSNRDFGVQVANKNGWWGEKIHRLKLNGEEKIRILFSQLKDPIDKIKPDRFCDNVDVFEFVVSQGQGKMGEGSIIIKSVKLF